MSPGPRSWHRTWPNTWSEKLWQMRSTSLGWQTWCRRRTGFVLTGDGTAHHVIVVKRGEWGEGDPVCDLGERGWGPVRNLNKGGGENMYASERAHLGGKTWADSGGTYGRIVLCGWEPHCYCAKLLGFAIVVGGATMVYGVVICVVCVQSWYPQRACRRGLSTPLWWCSRHGGREITRGLERGARVGG